MSAELAGDTSVVLLAAGLIFISALLLGIWKYRQMTSSPDGLAHPYVDTAHRAALLYSFATLLIAAFVEFSGWSETVDLIAALTLIFFFVAAIAGYCWHGAKRDTDNQMRGAGREVHTFMYALILGEVGAFAVLLAGFIEAQIL